jgi:hypothetical protein
MPLQIKLEEGRDRPVIVCDHCGEEITDARDGNYQWKVSAEGDRAEGHLYFTHKGCCRAFEAANRGDHDWYAMELACLPIFLGNNLNLNWVEAKKQAAVLASIG